MTLLWSLLGWAAENISLHKTRRTNMAKKLYMVTLRGEYFVRASNEREAQAYAEDYVRDSYDLVEHTKEVTDPDNFVVPADWDDECLVYGKGDMTLAEAFRRVKAGEPLE